MDHRKKCEELKGIRKVIADKLGIDLHQRKCTYEGECSGTCPRCAQEENVLKKALLTSTVALTAATLSACSVDLDNVSNDDDVSGRDRIEARKENHNKANKKDSKKDKKNKKPKEEPEALAGDVEYIPDPEIDDPEIDVLEGDVAYSVEDEIVSLCREYSGAPYAELDHYDGDKMVIHCYEEVDDEEDSHVATWDWITVDPSTGEAEDISGNTFNIWDY